MTTRDYLTLGPVPLDEDCLQTGKDSPTAIRMEAKRFALFLREWARRGGAPEALVQNISWKEFQHDFGSYTEAVVWYWVSEDCNPTETELFALWLEANTPPKWDSEKPEKSWEEWLVEDRKLNEMT